VSHQDRHDEARARRHAVLGRRRSGALDVPGRRGQTVVGYTCGPENTSFRPALAPCASRSEPSLFTRVCGMGAFEPVQGLSGFGACENGKDCFRARRRIGLFAGVAIFVLRCRALRLFTEMPS
jgi:hypothetical protein